MPRGTTCDVVAVAAVAAAMVSFMFRAPPSAPAIVGDGIAGADGASPLARPHQFHRTRAGYDTVPVPGSLSVPVFDAFTVEQRQGLPARVDISRPFVLRECDGLGNCSAFFDTFATTVVPDCLASSAEADSSSSPAPPSSTPLERPAAAGLEVGVAATGDDGRGALRFRAQRGRPLFRNVNFDMADASGIHVDEFQYLPLVPADFLSGAAEARHPDVFPAATPSAHIRARTFCYASEPVDAATCLSRRHAVPPWATALYGDIIAAAAARGRDDPRMAGLLEAAAGGSGGGGDGGDGDGGGGARDARGQEVAATAAGGDNGDPVRALVRDGSEERFSENVWMGTRGVMARTHYDQVHNFFTQLVGRKRFLLADPSLATSIGVYPRVHPFQRQICWPHGDPTEQLELDDGVAAGNGTRGGGGGTGAGGSDAVARAMDVFVRQVAAAVGGTAGVDDDRGLAPAMLYDVTLGPGDTLFLPRFWFHGVLALERSVSVSRTLRSYEVRIVEEMRDLPFPTEPGWPPGRLALVLRAYVAELVGAAEARVLHRTRYEAPGCRRRYSHADGGSSGGESSNAAFFAASTAADQRSTGWAQECPKIAARLRELGQDGDAAGARSARARLAGVVARAKRLAREKRGYLERISDVHLRRLVAFDDIELLVGTELGVPHLEPFLGHCFVE